MDQLVSQLLPELPTTFAICMTLPGTAHLLLEVGDLVACLIATVTGLMAAFEVDSEVCSSSRLPNFKILYAGPISLPEQLAQQALKAIYQRVVVQALSWKYVCGTAQTP